jgi:hypothetical protein
MPLSLRVEWKTRPTTSSSHLRIFICPLPKLHLLLPPVAPQ